jgi:2-polyprenyl-3-methyl-5-hydroxy-6-metoxy-1,4-benzoquinol methylase
MANSLRNFAAIEEFVTGEKFNPNCKVHFQFDLRVKNRDIILLNLIKDKNIIHVGCVDHLDILESKISAGTWLHGILMKSAKRCLGVDINKEGITYLRDHYNIPDLVVGNLFNEQIKEIDEDDWDYILFPEVIEHIPDAVGFLSSIHKKYSRNIKKIIVTVPNLYAYSLFKDASKNIETINTDHRYWFSPYTILKILHDAGIQTEDIFLINGFWGPFYCNIKERVISRLLKAFGKERDYKKISDMRYAKGLLVIAR